MKHWLPLLAALALPLAANNSLAADYIGSTVWANPTTLSSPLTGRVSSVKVAEGDEIKKGQLLATLDPRIYQATVKRAKARLKSIQSSFDDIGRQYERAQELFDRTVMSQTDLQSAEVTFLTSEAELHQAEAELELAKINLEYTQLRAPFDGIVVERNVNAFETVNNQYQITPMLRVAPKGNIAAKFTLPPNIAATLSKGEEVSLSLRDEDLKGIVQKSRAIGDSIMLTVGLDSPTSPEQSITLHLP